MPDFACKTGPFWPYNAVFGTKIGIIQNIYGGIANQTLHQTPESLAVLAGAGERRW